MKRVLGLFYLLLLALQAVAQSVGLGDIERGGITILTRLIPDPWEPVVTVMKNGIKTRGYPGAVGLVGDKKGFLFFQAVGNFTYGIPPPYDNGTNPSIVLDTLWDLASVTKVTGATNAIAQFYQRGEISLNDTVASIIGDQFSANGKGPITILNCLLHNAGFPPDPDPNYYQIEFGCPETFNYHPQENFSCQTKIYNSVMNQTLENPIGEIYVYSDLSFITLMYVVGHLARELQYVQESDLVPGCDTGGPGTDQCYFEAYVRLYVFQPLGMKQTGFLPRNDVWWSAAPTENDTTYLHETIQGQVSDGNAYAMGGIAGHAGIFSTASDLFNMAYRIMFATPNDWFLNSTTTKFFTTEYNHTQSCRALGWSTNDPTVVDQGWNQSCGHLMSPKAWTHIGYTGTQICGDPDKEIITIFLTNRVYPTSNHSQDHYWRQHFNDAVMKVLDSNVDRESIRQKGGIEEFERRYGGRM